MNQVIYWLMERLPIVKQLSGYKRYISRLVLLVAAILPLLKEWYPELKAIGDTEQIVIFLAGWLGLEVSWEHAAQKRVAAR